MTRCALSLENLRYSYRSDFLVKQFEALKPLNLEVREGESFGFLGHNGAGKTTTIKCVLNLIQGFKGEILLFGKGNRDPKAREQVGYLPEHPYFYDHLTVREALTMYAALAGVPWRQRKQAVSQALERLNIADREKTSLRTLSKGLTQRLGMAQAIISNPKLLILDEPFSGLDPIGRKEFKDLIFSLKQEGVTIFISSHILDDVQFLCDRASILVRGELKKILSLDELSRRPNDTYELVVHEQLSSEWGAARNVLKQEVRGRSTRLTFANHEAAQRVLKEFVNTGLEVETFRTVRESLEDQFVQVVKGEGVSGER
ncbi:MAG: ABC transporter ATP-binding protein [Bdellovibrionales bacterium]|nr:ABC transporter ATP-binding protein [Bdellovibrionales bacterium]